MRISVWIVTTLAVCIAGCGRDAGRETTATTPEARVEQERVQVQMIARDGTNLGTVTAESTGEGVRFSGRVTGLPAGERGIHVHETGSCEGPDFKSAGAHFNPTGAQHGIENPQGPHVGDMGNITVGADGTIELNVLARNATLGEGPNALLKPGGTALVIHAQRDDQRTDPAGNAGDRIACGVIGQNR